MSGEGSNSRQLFNHLVVHNISNFHSGEESNRRQLPTEVLLLVLRELCEFCRSDSLSEEGLRDIIERHGCAPNNNLNNAEGQKCCGGCVSYLCTYVQGYLLWTILAKTSLSLSD